MRFSFRRIAVVLAALLCTLGVVQVVSAAPPGADFTVSSSPQVNQPVQFTSSLSDSDSGQTYTYAWTFGDGGISDLPNPSHTYTEAGEMQVTLTVTDSGGETDLPVIKTVTVNAPPVASFACSPQTVRKNQAFTCTAASDPDGPVSYAWDTDGDGFNNGSDQSEQFSYPTPGVKTIALRVTDSDGVTRTTERTVTVINLAPSAEFSIEPNPAVINEVVTFKAGTSSDSDGRIIRYEWDLDGNGSYEVNETTPDGTIPDATRSYASPGTRLIKLRVTDDDGDMDERERQLWVQATRPNAGFSFAPQAPLPGQAIAFTSLSTPSSSSGPAITNTEWDFNYDPTRDFTTDATGPSATASFATPGPRTVAIRVTETGGGFALTSGTVVVNAPPQASFSVAPTSPLNGDSVTFASTSGDPDGPLTAQQWDLDGDGQFDDASGAVASRALATGSHTVRLRVTDSRGASATAERRIDVLRRPPRLLTGVKVTLFGTLTRRGVRLEGLIVRTPAKATARVTCKGRGCPRGVRAASKRPTKTRRLRFKRFQRSFPAGTLLTVTVTRPGYIGQHTKIKVRKNLRRYIRRDRCLPPGTRKPIACPDS